LIPLGQKSLSLPAANALPQALILTAIVIGFAMVTFLLVLLNGAYARTGTLDADDPPFLDESGDESPPAASDARTGESDAS
jgi:multicomponent Na+:H+ antiporter subunit C